MLLTVDRTYARVIADNYVRAALITDPSQRDNPVVFATRPFYDLTGYNKGEVIGRNCRFLQGPETDPRSVGQIRDALRAFRPITIDILNYCKNGTPFWNRLRIRPSFREDGSPEYFVGIQNPIPESDVRPFKIDHFID